MQGFDNGSTSLLPDSSSVLGGPAADLRLNRVERGNTRQHLGGERRLGRRVELEEVAPHVSPAECQSDRLIGTVAGQTLEAAVSVHLQHARELREMLKKPLSPAFLTSAAEAGGSVFKMIEVSRHKSMDSLPGYVRRADLFREHAGAAFLQPQLETITMGRSGETNGCV